MANTMLQNFQNAASLLSQIQNFSNNLKVLNKNPQTILNQMLQNGQVSREQVAQARQMAELFLKNNKNIRL